MVQMPGVCSGECVGGIDEFSGVLNPMRVQPFHLFRGTYMKTLFPGYSSAFEAAAPTRLT